MGTKTKRDIVKYIAREQGVPAKTVSKILTSAIGYIYGEVENGNRVTLRDFGRFEKRHHEERRCTLPGYESIVVPPYDVIAFKPSAHFN